MLLSPDTLRRAAPLLGAAAALFIAGAAALTAFGSGATPGRDDDTRAQASVESVANALGAQLRAVEVDLQALASGASGWPVDAQANFEPKLSQRLIDEFQRRHGALKRAGLHADPAQARGELRGLPGFERGQWLSPRRADGAREATYLWSFRTTAGSMGLAYATVALDELMRGAGDGARASGLYRIVEDDGRVLAAAHVDDQGWRVEPAIAEERIGPPEQLFGAPRDAAMSGRQVRRGAEQFYGQALEPLHSELLLAVRAGAAPAPGWVSTAWFALGAAALALAGVGIARARTGQPRPMRASARLSPGAVPAPVVHRPPPALPALPAPARGAAVRREAAPVTTAAAQPQAARQRPAPVAAGKAPIATPATPAATPAAAAATPGDERGTAGLMNRSHFRLAVQQAWVVATRRSTALSMAIIDVDGFSGDAGARQRAALDGFLVQVAAMVSLSFPEPGEITAQYGATQFAVLLPGVEETEATVQMNALRTRISDLTGTVHDGRRTMRGLTVSIGVGTVLPAAGDAPPQSLVEAAESACARARQEGGDRVRHASRCLETAADETVTSLRETTT